MSIIEKKIDTISLFNNREKNNFKNDLNRHHEHLLAGFGPSFVKYETISQKSSPLEIHRTGFRLNLR